MIRTEFVNFLQTLENTSTAEATSVRKIANLVYENLETLIPLSTTNGQRIRKLVELAQNSWSTVSSDLSTVNSTQISIDPKLKRLKKLTVGPFRGFSRQEVFDLDSRVVLIYGPNGTGKTSFCEALEYTLLGSVEEAGSKRFRDQNEYLKNAYVNTFTKPTLEGLTEQNVDIEILPDHKKYQFSFIEKNRIDNFSRIAAQAPAKQTELISTLFGLDSFNDFVRNFTNEMDGRYIHLEGLKAKLLEEKQHELSGAHQQIQSSLEILQVIQAEKIKLANEYRAGISFNEMEIELLGTDHNPGLVKQLEVELQSPLKNKSNMSSKRLHDLKQDLDSLILKLNSLDKSLIDYSQEISFKSLYLAIVELTQSNLEKCPACQTSLKEVSINPFVHAEIELEKFGELTSIQELHHKSFNDFKEKLQEINNIIGICTSFYQLNNCLIEYTNLPEDNLKKEWWINLETLLEDRTTIWSQIETQVKALESIDNQINHENALRSVKSKDLNKYREYQEKIIKLKAQEATINETIKNAKLKIENFEKDNANLIAEVGQEKYLIEVNKGISRAYSTFVRKLQSYCSNLPQRLVSDLESQIVRLYNAFNRNDRPSELIAHIKLPITPNQRMEISFKNNPTRYFDALHILSEGHIRCIGLAIVLAKNLKEESPLIIFDDPVNAIDDEHREAIRKTLFEDDYFANKQILVACHGEEFFKDISNLLPSTQASLAKNYVFLPKLDEQHLNIDFRAPSRNYILAARQHIERNEIRDALTKSRQALEALTKDKIWSYVNRFGDGNLSLKLRSAKSPIELRNLTEQLKSKIGKNEFSHPNKNLIYDPLDSLLGVNGDSREWRYLNKGTHEEQDRAEFDRQSVLTIITSLEHIERAFAS